MGRKYIIEIEDENFHQYSDSKSSEYLWRVKGFNSLVFDEVGLRKLTPYAEDSAYAHGYTEAESKYREIRDELEKQAYQRGYKEAYDTAYADAEEIYESGKRVMYQKGLKDAWECARKICLNDCDGGLTVMEIAKIFDVSYYRDVMKKYSASEVIEKIRQYEQEQEQEAFHVGDEFVNRSGDKFVITKMDGEEIDRYIDEYGRTYAMNVKYSEMRKTGRHFPEIAEVLAKMKESDNG